MRQTVTDVGLIGEAPAPMAAHARIRILPRGWSWPAAMIILASVALAGCGPASAAGGASTARGKPGGATSAAAPAAAAAPQFTITPAASAANVSPRDAVTVRINSATLSDVTVASPGGRPVNGAMSGDHGSWMSSEPLGYGKTYTVTANAAAKSGGAPLTTTSTFTTATPRAQVYPQMNPLDGQVVGVGQPIAIYFDRTITDRKAAEAAITVHTSPAVSGAFYWFSAKEVHWRPENYWAAGTQVSVDLGVYGRDLGGGVYGKQDRSVHFSVGDALVAEADGASHQMTVKINGQLVRTMPIAMGRPSRPSNSGVHVVTEKFASMIMDSSTFGLPVDAPGGYRVPVAFATRISNDGEFVHSAPWSVGDQGRRNVSHGCVNVSPANAQWFFNLVKKGDVVVLTNTGGPVLQSWDGFGDWNVPWPEWTAGGPGA
jgi:lipoprotein-anchoring transpeptidase ErfK/SrfK